MPARLTTHVLDLSTGRPAEGVAVTLTRLADGAVLGAGQTNADGRLDAPLLQGDAFLPGSYEITFAVGDYFRAAGAAVSEPAFLDLVPIRFGLPDVGHTHVPLLISPYGYSTYRGS